MKPPKEWDEPRKPETLKCKHNRKNAFFYKQIRKFEVSIAVRTDLWVPPKIQEINGISLISQYYSTQLSLNKLSSPLAPRQQTPRSWDPQQPPSVFHDIHAKRLNQSKLFVCSVYPTLWWSQLHLTAEVRRWFWGVFFVGGEIHENSYPVM